MRILVFIEKRIFSLLLYVQIHIFAEGRIFTVLEYVRILVFADTGYEDASLHGSLNFYPGAKRVLG
jgi:hypothetical protein